MHPGARFVAAGLVVSAAACTTTGESPPRPLPAMPAHWSESADDTTAASLASSAWWKMFHDGELDSLVQRAVQANPDLQLAEARVREARAREGVASAGLSPSLLARASAAREKESANAPRPVLIGPGGTLDSTPGETENLFQAGFDATWELDIFGGKRWALNAARADLASSFYDRDAALVTLLGDVARNYIELRGLQQRMALVRASLSSQEDVLELTRSRSIGGMNGELDVARAEAQVQVTGAQLPALEASYAASLHRLGVLLGEAPRALAHELSPAGPIPAFTTELPIGLPSDLLRQRPDIRSAERRVAATFARSRAATAALYPRFSIAGAIGLASVAAGDFFDRSSALWSIGPTMTWPIFDGGRLKATIQVRDAQEQQALILYRRAILIALEDVENAQASYRREKERTAVLAKAVEATRRARDFAHSRYVGGLGDFRDVAQAQRDLLGAEAEWAQSQATASIAAVALAKALGGGWDAVALPQGFTVEAPKALPRSAGGGR